MCNLGQGTTQNNPADSCSDVIYTCPSGFYWIRSPKGTAVQLYCDMDRVCGCNSTGGWTPQHDRPQPAVSKYMNPTNTQFRTKEAIWKVQ